VALVKAGLGIETCPHLGCDVVIECPQFYKTSNPKAIETLLLLVGALRERAQSKGGKVKLVHPHDWKGSVKKEAMLSRIVSKLDAAELEMLMRIPCSVSKRHNIIDAIGLGLKEVGRL
jgi:hypothetical protein